MSNPGRVEASSVFVVSGGGRGITAQCIIRLARQYHCKFILLGRTALSEAEPSWATPDGDEAQLKKRLIEYLGAQIEKATPVKVKKLLGSLLAQREIKATLKAIEAAGGQTEYLGVDITDSAALQSSLAGAVERLGPITGIIHGAGNLADKLIENKSAEDFETVYAAKVQGLENLLQHVPPGQLHHLILFSSVAGFYGNSGQADYALANEILNKTAFLVKRQHPGCRVLSLNWGPWDGGMVTPALKEFFNQNQIEIISMEAGTQRLVDELNSDHEIVQIVVGSAIKNPVKPLDPKLKTYRLRRKLTLKDNPFLLDHQIGGNPVLPAICVINWVANACEQLYPGYSLYISEENKVLKGVVFDNTLAHDYTLELKEISKDAAVGEIVFEGVIWSKNSRGRHQYHYSARTTLRREVPAAPIYSEFNRDDSQALDGAKLYQDGTLFHGPSFQGVKRVLNISRERVTLECFLPPVSERQQGQFPVQNFNPYAVDSQLQCMLIWTRHFYQAASLPLKIQRVEQYRALPFGKIFYATLEVQTSSETGLVANVTAHDAEGRIYTRVIGSEVTISKRLNSLFAPAGGGSQSVLTSV
jgi:NAD(P)-dependent dehydrogenase (short-subunit alcohol dehydrogenase family)